MDDGVTLSHCHAFIRCSFGASLLPCICALRIFLCVLCLFMCLFMCLFIRLFVLVNAGMGRVGVGVFIRHVSCMHLLVCVLLHLNT